MKQMRQIMMTVALMLTAGAMAQSVDETQPKDGMPEMAMRPQRMKRITQEHILVGSDSELTLILSDGSSFTGCIAGNITNAAGDTVSKRQATQYCTVNIITNYQ